MKLTGLQLHEGQRIPWWGRIWRCDLALDVAWVLPIPICWVARLAWNLWCTSFKYRRNAWERALQRAWAAGHEAGIDVKRGTSEHRDLSRQEWLAMLQEVSEALLGRITRLSEEEKG